MPAYGSSLKALIFLERVKLKNNIRLIIKKPWRLLIYLGYLMGIVSIFIPQLFMRKNNLPVKWHLNPEIPGAIATVILFGIFFLALNGITRISPLEFETADMTFLFPSPVSSRVVIGWNMIFKVLARTCIKIALPLLIVLPSMNNLAEVGVNPNKSGYFILGIILMTFLNFLFTYAAYLSSLHFKIVKKYFTQSINATFIFLLLLIIYMGWPWAHPLQNLLKTLNSQIWLTFPVFGWLRNLLLAPFVSSQDNMGISLLGILLFTTLLFVFVIYLARDYYEEAGEATLKRAELNNITEQTLNEILVAEKVKKIKSAEDTGFTSPAKGPWALLWLNMVRAKRLQNSLFPVKKIILSIIVGIIAGYFIKSGKISVENVLIGSLFFFSFRGGMSALEEHLGKQYIYLIPGKAWQKVIASVILPAIFTVSFYTAFIITIGIMVRINPMKLVSYFAFFVSFSGTNLFNGIVAYILMPHRFDRNTVYPLIKFSVLIIFLIPSLIVFIITNYLTKSREVSLLFASIANFCIIGILLTIIDKLFAKLEMV